MNQFNHLLESLTEFRRKHPPIRNVNVEYEEGRTFGQKVSDNVTALLGSWPFVIVQSIFLALWMAFNTYLLFHPHTMKPWDPYPFILLNLVLSFQAAYTGPVVMMSQNRHTEKDRLAAQHDYEINVRAEEQIEMMIKHLAHQNDLIMDLLSRLPASETADDSERKPETV